jgi:hypothetical protein
MKGVYFFALAVLICDCSSLAQDKFITVGTGGGFAGTSTVYKVTAKGEVFKGNGVGDIKFTLCGKIKRAKAKEIIAKVTDQARAASPFSHPGNLYYFIASTENGNEQTVTWGDVDHPVSEEVKKVYDEVQASVNSVEFKPIK